MLAMIGVDVKMDTKCFFHNIILFDHIKFKNKLKCQRRQCEDGYRWLRLDKDKTCGIWVEKRANWKQKKKGVFKQKHAVVFRKKLEVYFF